MKQVALNIKRKSGLELHYLHKKSGSKNAIPSIANTWMAWECSRIS